MTVRFDSGIFDSTFRFWFDFLHIVPIVPSVSYYIVKLESRTHRCLQFVQSFVHHFVLLGETVALLPTLEKFKIRQTMCDPLIFTFSNMATNDQAIVNPLASLRSAVCKYYGFPAKDSTADKVLCRLNFKHAHS